jgi:hypothetical protein
MTPDELQELTHDLDVQKFVFSKEQDDRQRHVEAQRFAATQTLEHEKIKLEKRKAKWAAISVFVTAISILGSVMVAAFTILESDRLQKQIADTQFSLKAADLVLQSDDPEVNANKASRFQRLFPGRVPRNWGKDFDPQEYVAENDDMKKDFAKLLIEHPNQSAQIIATYQTLFADDRTVQAFLGRLKAMPQPK